MLDQTFVFLQALLDQTGAINITWQNLVMIAISITMIYLAIAKHYDRCC
ncbi:MAG: hypothetical protein U1E63_13185 [Burkholderiales bacterium]